MDFQRCGSCRQMRPACQMVEVEDGTECCLSCDVERTFSVVGEDLPIADAAEFRKFMGGTL